MGPQIAQQFLHRSVGECVIAPAVARMFGRGEPGFHGITKLVGRHPGMGERQDLHQAIKVVAFQEFAKIAG